MTAPTSTLTLADFLLARVDEDEAVAQAATSGPWDALDGGVVALHVGDGAEAWPVTSTETPNELVDRTHIARHDPARVLAECEAKRAVVGLHWVTQGTTGPRCAECAPGTYYDYDPMRSKWPCGTLRALAFPYADHPDFRDEWRP